VHEAELDPHSPHNATAMPLTVPSASSIRTAVAAPCSYDHQTVPLDDDMRRTPATVESRTRVNAVMSRRSVHE
jgi:hypothetical protein